MSGQQLLFVCVWVAVIVVAGFLVNVAGRWAFVAGRQAYWRWTGTRPALLDTVLAARVARECAAEFVGTQKIPEEERAAAIKGTTVLIHKAISSYEHRRGEVV